MKQKVCLGFIALIMLIGVTLCLVACDDEKHNHNLTHVEEATPTCSEDGNIEYWYCKDCGKYFSDSNAEVEIMANDTIIVSKGHNYGDWTIIKPATCTEEGKRSKECSVCHDVVEETIAALGHNFSEWKVITAATCTTDGVKERVCSVCGYKDEEVVYATGHDIQNNVCTNCGIKATEGLRFKYVEGNGIAGVFCVGWDDVNASNHGYNHSEDEYDSVDLIIPDVYEGYPVIGIEMEWTYSFLNDLCIRSVTLPDSVVYIGDQAFYGCKYLESVSLGASIDYIGTEAFDDTALEANIENYDNGLLYINSRDRSSKYLINSQSDLTQATIDDQTKVISSDAFLDSSASLESLTFGTNIIFIYDMTFSYCENLHKVYFNGTVDDWMKIYFYSDSANPLSNGADLYLNGVLLTDLNINNISEVGISFLGCTSIQRINLEGVTSIDNKAFLNCINLTDVNLPDSLTSIGYSAFSGCYNLKNIILPKGLESLGRDVFYGCSSLEAIKLDSENTAFVLKDGVLYNAEMTELVCILQSYNSILSLPDSVDLQNGDAFYYLNLCLELSQIEVSENNLYYKSYNGVVYSTTVDYDYQFMYVPKGISGKIELPDDIVVVSGFANTNISEIILGENTTRVESSAFENCTQLKSVVIPDSVLEIGPSAFMGCTNLTDVVIGNKVKYIGYYAFKDCNLENVTFKHYTGWTNGLTNEVDEEELQNSQKAAMLLGDENSDDWVNSGLYVANFIADGVLIDSIEYELDSTIDIAEPQIPEKIGYTASWEEYSLTGDIIINAIYTPISYHVTFKAGGITISSQTYTVEDYDIEIPTVPEKQGYNGQWDYELKEGDTGDIVINASYEIITYIVTFVADEEIISQQEYTVENYDIIIPAVPEKTGYDAKWQDYTLTTGDITINAIYSIINYKVTFIINDEISAVEYYNVENYNINIPTIPQKVGYEAMWREDPSIDSDFILQEGRLEDIVVTAVYDAILYTVTFIAKEEIVAKETYTVEDYDITIPAVPLDVNYIDYYEGEWEEFELTIGDITVNALYSTKNATKGIEYTLSDDGKSYNVTGYSGDDTYILIPDLYKNKPVLGLEWYSFVDNDTIETVKISNGITSTMGSVFSNCSNLKTVYVPITLQQTAFASPFNNCPNLENVYCEAVNKPISWSLDMYDSYWQWGYNNNTYRDFTYVTHVGFNGYEAYITSYNGNSNEVSIPTGIGNYAVVSFTWIFSQNNNIERVNIPQTVTSIYDYAFYNCQNLKTVSFDNIFSQIEGIGKYTFANCSSLTNIIIPNSVTTIDYCAFNNCKSLISINIPQNLVLIDLGAFEGCDKLVEIYNLSKLNIQVGNTDNGYIGYNALNVYTLNSGESKLNTIEDGYVFYVDDELVILVGYVGILEDIVLPDNYEGNTYKLSQCAFYNCNYIKSITIPETLKIIGNDAFALCDSIETAIMPGWVIRFIPQTNLKNVTITCGEIEEDAFSNCSSLVNVTIMDEVTGVGDSAFENCYLLNYNEYNGSHYLGNDNNPYLLLLEASDYLTTSFNINENTKFVHSKAFRTCHDLKTVYIPSSVISIGSEAFRSCNLLEGVYITDIDSWCRIYFSDSTANPLYYAENLYLNNELVRDLVIPDGIININQYAFYNCKSITSLFISNSVELVNSSAFYNCYMLTSVTIGTNVKSIDSYAFGSCPRLVMICNLSSLLIEIGTDGNGYIASNALDVFTSIEDDKYSYALIDDLIFYENESNVYLIGYAGTKTEITLPEEFNGKQYIIKDYAFYNCKELTNVTISDGVTQIGDYAFYQCSSLISIDIPNSVEYLGKSAFAWCSSLENITIGTGINIINNGAFYGCSSLTNVNIPIGVEEIGESAFEQCSSLENIIIPDGMLVINDSAFYNCYSLTSIIIPNSVESIGTHAFYKCSSLKSVILPENLKQIQNMMFSGCTSLESIIIPESVTSILDSAFNGCSSLTSIIIPNNVISIGEYAFENCTSLNSLIIGNCIETIGKAAFSNCYNITQITIPASVTYIDYQAFYGCYKLVEVYNLSKINIEKGSYDNGYVGYYAINVYNSLDEKSKINITDDGYIFYEDNQNVYLIGYNGTEVDIILPRDYNGKEYIINDYAFYGNKSLVSVFISDNVISIGESAFSNCNNLSSVIIGQKVEYIDYSAFYGCSALKSITIPNSVTNIGDYAFYNCSSLEIVIIGNGVTNIGQYVFDGCSSLNVVYYKGTAEDWSKITINIYNPHLNMLICYYYSATEPTLDGNYWHYDEDGVTPVIWVKG